jgi:hypothetical protein
MKRAMTLKVLIPLTALPLTALLAAFACFSFAWPANYTEIRNLSGQMVTDVVLELRDHQTEWAVTERVASLRPGGLVRIRHSHSDTSAVLQFGIGGQRFRHDDGYIDLWAGEGWRFDIQPDGTVKSGYHSSERR